MKTTELYQAVTQQVIQHLEEGVPPWVRPWKDSKLRGVGMIPSNLITGRLYSGGNILLLWMTATAQGYGSLQFCTYQQAAGVGANVRKGEKSTHILFAKPVLNRTEDDEVRGGVIVKAHSVFHVSQLENLPERFLEPQGEEDTAPDHQQAIELVSRSGVTIRHGGNRAAYSQVRDDIVLPAFSAFKEEVDYWGTAFHELTHATGHPSRLAREFGKRFGDQRYAFEELVGELGAAFLGARMGIPATFRSASYIDNWLTVLKGDHSAVFHAASHASKAADWLWNKSFPMQEAAE